MVVQKQIVSSNGGNDIPAAGPEKLHQHLHDQRGPGSAKERLVVGSRYTPVQPYRVMVMFQQGKSRESMGVSSMLMISEISSDREERL